MSILRNLITAVMAATVLSAAPVAALASTAQPGTTRPAVSTSTQPRGTAVLKPAGASAVPNPHCNLELTLFGTPGVVIGAKAALACRNTVTKITVEACVQQLLHGKWRYIVCKTGHRSSGRSLTVTASNHCTSRNRNEFRATGHATVTYRGHTFTTGHRMTRAVSFACGTQ